MNWLAENWFWLLVVVVFIAVHFWGHGGHGKQNDSNDEDQQHKNRTTDPGHKHN
ncbi:hypothetical protein BMS3Abin04_00485 [bacterium BMS3Abin04]|nr:hypothetical protein BMS3Abin04_00485 [bacterium BMS3Abin04]